MSDVFGPGFRIFALMLAGALAVVGLPALVDALSAPGVPAMWWASRSLGLVSYVALWFSVLFGTLLSGGSTTKALFDRAVVLELHNAWSVAALALTALHVLFVVVNPHADVSALALVVPWASGTLTGAIGVGTLATWGLLALGASTALQARLPRTLWRAVHASAFGSFVLALVHSFAAGTDTSSPAVRAVYAGTSAVLLGAVLWRAAVAFHERRAGAAYGVGDSSAPQSTSPSVSTTTSAPASSAFP